jgi:hypothetical protein
MHLNSGLGTRRNEEEGADSGVNETVETENGIRQAVIELAVSSVGVFEVLYLDPGNRGQTSAQSLECALLMRQ